MNTRTRVFLLGLVLLLAAVLPVLGAGAGSGETRRQPVELERLVLRGVESYREALDTPKRDLRLEGFHRSERFFAAAVAGGARSADLYANLGNAALQGERLGDAVLAYRRALLLDPDHARARQNLTHARSLTPPWVPRPEVSTLIDTFFFWHRALARGERSLLAAICFALATTLVAAALRWRSLWARNLAIAPAIAWCGLLTSLALDPAAAAAFEGVVTASETIGRSADSIHAPQRFAQPLPSGTEVRILERRDGWLHVALANGRDAWVAESSVATVGL